MSQAISTHSHHPFHGLHMSRRLREGFMLVLWGVAIYLVVSFYSFNPDDPGWSYIGPRAEVTNEGGAAGAWLADVGLNLFGVFAYLLPVMLAWSGVLLYREADKDDTVHVGVIALRWVGFLMVLVSGSALAAINVHELPMALPSGSGGMLGDFFARAMVGVFSVSGGSLLTLAVFLAGFTFFTGVSWFFIMDLLGGAVLLLARSAMRLRDPLVRLLALRVRWLGRRMQRVGAGSAAPAPAAPGPADKARAKGPDKPPKRQRQEPVVRSLDLDKEEFGLPSMKLEDADFAPDERRREPTLAAAETPGAAEPAPFPPPAKKTPRKPKSDSARQLQLLTDPPAVEGPLPNTELLDPPVISNRGYTDAELETLSRQVEAKLADFKVSAQVVAVHPGPVVTLFELELAPGTKASKVTNLSTDLARALSTTSVRVVEVIPGKTAIGLEIPNTQREMVYLREVMESPVYNRAKSKVTLLLGKDISGKPVTADLAKMPHLLVAGTTGSGKSVAVNAMILSLLFKSTAEEVRVIMVDPKMLELSVYEGIPHLLTPVVTDMEEAGNALRWCVQEMERRYRLMAALGVRNLASFNNKVRDAEKRGEPIADPLHQLDPNQDLEAQPAAPNLEPMPHIVVIIDELADLMMVVGKKVEQQIARLAQKARAAGIHLILATQRPSVDVITGLIKANIPTRIAFQVSSRVDSRTILDRMGAEHLLGHGDMLYLPPGTGFLQRLHGAFVSDDEVHRVVEFLKTTGEPRYEEDVLKETGDGGPGMDFASGDTEDTDPLFDGAVRHVIETQRASISGVQRKFKIGYNRAARLVDEMERIGIVSPPESNGNRRVLVPPPAGD